MMVRRWLQLLALAFATLSLACSADKTNAPTQIVVTVDSDLAVPGDIDSVRIQVVGNGKSDVADADLTKEPLPRTLGLVHSSGPLGPITIRATGLLAGEPVVEREVVTSFVEHSTSLLTIALESACKGVFCQDGLTCDHGVCDTTPVVGPHPDEPGDDAGASEPDQDGSISSDDNGDAGMDPGADSGTGSPGGAPSCVIDLPAEGDAYQVGKKVTLQGSCSDPEQGALSRGLTWTSNLDGALTAASGQTTLTSVGDHQLKLCAVDPEDASVMGCASVMVKVTSTPQPAATITDVSQAGSMSDPFDPSAEVAFSGEGSGAGVTLAWTDSMQGTVGDGAQETLAAPAVGRHRVTLTVTDRDGQSASVTRDFVVLAPDEKSLVDAFTKANDTLASAGGASVAELGSDDKGRAYAASNEGTLYTFDPTDPSADASLALDNPPLRGVVHGMDFAESNSLAYFASADGLTVCTYVSLTGLSSLCNSFTGSNLKSDDILSVLRMTGSDNKDHLLVGTESGVMIAKSLSGDNQGDVKLENRKINAIAPSAGIAWLATDGGLYRLNPATGSTLSINGAGAPSAALSGAAVDSKGAVWVSTAGGLYQFTPGDNHWRSFHTSDGLADDQVNDVAISRVTIDDEQRDVVWAATAGGVSRLDPAIGTFVTLGTADGLPSDEVLDVLVLSDGTKLFGTDAGIARCVSK
jgi:hypothetical protein